MTARTKPLIIAGGGLAGGLAALALAERRPEVPLLLVEQGPVLGGNHIWSFFDSDVDTGDRPLVDPFVARHWPSHDIRFPGRSRTLELGYNSIRSADFDRILRARLRPDQLRLGQAIVELASDHVVLDGGERIAASGVIDARGPTTAAGLDLGWQKFVGRTYRFARPHDCVRPMVMDATVDQGDGYRFAYLLPFSDTELMVEDTYYSTSLALDPPALAEGIDRLAAARGSNPEMIAEESGVLPVLLGGKVNALWPATGPPIARLGLRGGFFHPTTGYSLPDAVRNAALLADQRDLGSRALHRLFKVRAESLWKERRFFILLNRMLLRAAEPADRYRVLEHFYRLPEVLIGHFYAARLTPLDKLKILSGRPPVPVARALSALAGSAR